MKNKVTEIILKEIRTIHEDNKYFRNSISSLNIDGSSYDRKIENLTIRVEKLELKQKNKKMGQVKHIADQF